MFEGPSMQTLTSTPALSSAISESERTATLFAASENVIQQRTDRMFAWLMAFQWLGGIIAALWISPRTWEGTISHTHVHVWAAVFLGGVISAFPIFLAW